MHIISGLTLGGVIRINELQGRFIWSIGEHMATSPPAGKLSCLLSPSPFAASVSPTQLHSAVVRFSWIEDRLRTRCSRSPLIVERQLVMETAVRDRPRLTSAALGGFN